MTAHAMQGDRERCFQAGMNDYISKPVAPTVMVALVEQWLSDIVSNDRVDTPSPEALSLETADDAVSTEEQLSLEDGAPFLGEQVLIERLLGDIAMARVVTHGFLQDIPEQIKEIETLVGKGAAQEAGQKAHAIKGAAATIGGQALEKIALKMEQAGKTGNLPLLRKKVPALREKFAEIKALLEASTLGSPDGIQNGDSDAHLDS
jgi:HPt (histidine-containing phosphotransfer) domain-containing protein